MLIGWREWVGLPALKLPLVKAKIDTGARTSSLHAFKIETFSERGAPMVRFHVHPLQMRQDIVVVASAPVVDNRIVSDSGGHRERRLVIVTPLVIGGLELPIEVTLANRESMIFRFLLGRSAMTPFFLDPTQSFVLGRPEEKPSLRYKRKRRKA
jgi:hypothetical protein